MTRIGLIGDFDSAATAHRAIPKAIALAAEHLDILTDARWLATEAIPDDPQPALQDYSGLWCVPASPYRRAEGALAAIRYARESNTPFLGTCGGFQHAVLEYARSVLNHPEAAHAEIDPDAPMALLSPLACSLVEQAGSIRLLESTQIRAIYGVDVISEQYHCRFGVNPAYEALFDRGDLKISGRDPTGEVRAVELPTHPFFIATLFQPERSALAGKVHPLIAAFLAAAARSTRHP